MTQTKPMKKKKKTKTEKPKNEETKVKQSSSTLSTTPVDKRKKALNNVREMIKEAHQMHKNHTRSLKGMSTLSSKDTIGKPKQSVKPTTKSSNDRRLLTIEMSERNSTIKKGEVERSMSLIKLKMQRRLSNEIMKMGGSSRKSSTESCKKKIYPVVSGQRASADLQPKKKEKETITRGGSAVFPARKQVDVPKGQGFSEFSVAREERQQTRESGKKRESSLKINDYHVGSFVSLELVDKMKCRESDTCIRTRKSILRQSRHSTQKGNAAPSKSSDGDEKKSKKVEKRKKENSSNKNKSFNHKMENVEKIRKTEKNTSSKRGTADSESAPAKTESIAISQKKSVISNPKSASSNMDSNISSITGAGDLFSTNTSRSYFSSDSDISKIDKKFMQILEAVTQTKIGFEERARQITGVQSNVRNGPSTSEKNEEEMGKREPSELEQKLMDRIRYLEQKLESSKNGVSSTEEENKVTEIKEKGDVSSKAGVEELWKKLNENNSPKPVTKEVKGDTATKLEKASKLFEGRSIQDAAQLPRPPRRKQEPVTEVKINSMPESARERENDGSKRGSSAKKRRRYDTTSSGKETSEKVARGVSTEGDKSGCKRVETWSIIKRLEKAFQTLGLNLEDLDNSDEEENENAAAKKKPQVKKPESSGEERRVLPQSETLRKCQEAAVASTGSGRRNAPTIGDSPFGVETNGSGDKNMEYKRVRNSRKMEDLARLSKEKSMDKNHKEAYYASVGLPHKIKLSQGSELNGLLNGKHVELIKSKSLRKKSRECQKHAAEHGIIQQKPKTRADEPRSSKRYGKRPHKSNIDDAYRHHGKSKSVHSLSLSCSASSLSEEDPKKSHKRKKKNHSLVREPYVREKEDWTNTNGKGDTAKQMPTPHKKGRDREFPPEKKNITEKVKMANANVPLKTTQEILKMEAENDELELKQIRQRHRQIISEIKLSLQEIKKQHNLCTTLQRQTRQFNRDCHAKRRMLASYLRDVETNYDRRNGRHQTREITSRRPRALSTDSYYYSRRQNEKIQGKLSDFDVARLDKCAKEDSWKGCEIDETVLSIIDTDNETSTVSEVLSSILLEQTSTELVLTDTSEESYRSMTSSLHTVCRKYRSNRDNSTGDGIESIPMTWDGGDIHSFGEDGVKLAPTYLVQLLQKLNKIIVTEKSQLENLVVRASASSNRTTRSNKTKSSGSGSRGEQHYKSKKVTRPEATENEIRSTNLSGNGSTREHITMGSAEEGIPMSISTSFIIVRGNPGECSFDSLLDQDRITSESHQTNRMNSMSQCGKSCIHLEKHAEEHRYRKGDPSFRSQALLLQQLGEHSRHCMEKVSEDDASWKRKLELERILRVNEKAFRRTTSFGRDTDTHALDYDPYITVRGRRGSHRQQSIIIDHNHSGEEENDESQTVLGHASRHSGALRKHERKIPHEYLKAKRKCESSHHGRHHDFWKKGKRHHADDVPINLYDISANTPGSSVRLKDTCCQTDNVEDCDDIGEMYLLEECGSSPSLN